MGRKPKIIPHIPGTLEQITDAMFAKDKVIKKTKTGLKNKDTKNKKSSAPLR